MNARAKQERVMLHDSGLLTTSSGNTLTRTLKKSHYKHFQLVINGITSTSLEMELIIDGITTNNYAGQGGTYAATGVRTALAEAAQAQCPLLSTVTLTGAKLFTIIADMYFTSNVDSLLLLIRGSQENNYLSEDKVIYFFDALVTDNEITSLLIEPSTGTWTGSWQLYGYK